MGPRKTIHYYAYGCRIQPRGSVAFSEKSLIDSRECKVVDAINARFDIFEEVEAICREKDTCSLSCTGHRDGPVMGDTQLVRCASRQCVGGVRVKEVKRSGEP
jgi:hypothetical protein